MLHKLNIRPHFCSCVWNPVPHTGKSGQQCIIENITFHTLLHLGLIEKFQKEVALLDNGKSSCGKGGMKTFPLIGTAALHLSRILR